MGFVRDWQKKLGYRHDPFTERPSKKVSDYFVGREEEREHLNLFIIKQKRFGLLSGSNGIGKSVLAGWLQEQVKDKALLVSATKKKELFDTLMQSSLNFVERLFTKPHQKVTGENLTALLIKKLSRRERLVIIDDAHQLENDQKWLVKQLLDHCKRVQVILVIEKSLKEHSNYGEDDLHLELTEMPSQELKLLIRRRIELAGGMGTWPFDDNELDIIITKSKKNPVKLLELARDRAIELSLKPRLPPKTAAIQAPPPTSQAETQEIEIPETIEEQEPVQQKRPWFKLVRNDEERIAYEQAMATDTPQPTVYERPSEQAQQEAAELDAALAAALVETSPRTEKTEQKETKSAPAAHHTVHKGPIAHTRRRGR